jgi:hypothetical protein
MVKFFYVPAKNTNSVCIAIGFPATCNYWTIKSLSSGGTPLPGENLDACAVLFSSFEGIKSKLNLNIMAGAKSKVISIEPTAHHDSFVISATCSHQLSSIRKVLSTVFKNISKIPYASYSRIIRLLGEKPDKEAYNFELDKMHGGLKNMSVMITGKINIDKVKPIAEKTATLLEIFAVDGKKSKRQTGGTQEISLDEIKASNVQNAILIKKYLDASGITSHLVGTSVFHQPVPMGPIKNKKRIDSFVEKFLALKSEAIPQLIFIGATLGCTPASLDAIPKTVTKSVLSSGIDKALT